MIVEAFRRAGADVEMGSHLYRAFRAAGLRPQMIAHGRAEAGPESAVYESLARVAQSMLPAIERFGLATKDELQLENCGPAARRGGGA